MGRRGTWKWVTGAAVAAAGVAAYTRWVQPLYRHWGASDEEVEGPMPGDGLVGEANLETTRAVEIEARPTEVWPWLAQMGAGRGGAYSYDWIHRLLGFLDEPSAEEILPKYQHVHRGDIIPFAGGTGFRVERVHAGRSLVLVDAEEAPPYTMSWAFKVDPVAAGHTRLVVRGRARVGWSPTGLVFRMFVDPAAFFMERKMLLGIKERAERIARRTERALESMGGNPEGQWAR